MLIKKILLKLRLHLSVLGVVQAGFPSPAEEELIDTLSLDAYLIRNPQASFLAEVTSDAMTGAGIMTGDLVIVERGPTPKHGQIILVQMNKEWTLKYYEKQKGKIALVSANTKYPAFIPTEELNVAGVVKAVVRRYA